MQTRRTASGRDQANAVVVAIGDDDVARRIQTHAIWHIELSLQWSGAVDVTRITDPTGHRRHH